MAGETILIVDDDPTRLSLARASLASEGYVVRSAEDAQGVRAALREQRPALIVIDLQSPGMDALRLVRSLKDDGELRSIPVVAVTAFTLQGDEELALKVCDAYLTKPVEAQALSARVRSILSGGSQARREGTVLVVEDNPSTRRYLRVALELEGYRVVEAEDGASAVAAFRDAPPDVVLLDLRLPDGDGVEVAERLRALPGADEVPVVALSGFMQRLELRVLGAGFSAFLVKPVDPAHLGRVVGELLKAGSATPPQALAGRRLLVADDDPLQLKLLRLQLSTAGFEVMEFEDGERLVRAARADPPDAIVCDVIMPGRDGFETCLELRTDPALRHVPVILISSHYGEELDQQLARRVGASALLSRSDGYGAIVDRIVAALREPTPPVPAPTQIASHHKERVVRQLERQVIARAGLEQRCALQAAQLTVLGTAAEALAQGTDVEETIRTVLAFCFDAASVSYGALFLRSSDGALRLSHSLGFTSEQEIARLFGHPEILAAVAQQGVITRLPSRAVDREVAAEILAGAGVPMALLVPLITRGDAVGVLFVGLNQAAGDSPVMVRFAETLANQIGQAVGLAQSFRRLAESEQRSRSLLESARCGFFVIGIDGLVVEANPDGCELLEAKRDEIVGAVFLDLLTPECASTLDAIVEQVRAGHPVDATEVAFQTPSGARRDTLVSCSAVRWVDRTMALCVVQDVTEQRALQRQLVRAQKLESIGKLAGGIAHDFNNMLMPIMGFAELARGTLEEEHSAQRFLDQITRAADRAATLTRQILAFARRQVLQPEVVDLNEVVNDCAPMLTRLISEDIEVVRRPSSRDALVEIDPGQLEQVLMNLVINARDAMPDGGQVVIETTRVDFDAPDAPPGVEPGRYVELTVADTGVGMDADVQRCAFEPFFTTKPQGEGTGLGLAMVHGIVSQSGGYLTLESAPGEGATFRIYLPRVGRRAGDRADGSGEEVGLRGAGQRILVVEDEDLVRQLLTEALRTLGGYTVLEARTGAEALEMAAREEGGFDLLLIDMVMPGLHGVEVARRLSEARPGLKVLFMSGYPSHPMLEGLGAGVDFMHKPITPHGLLEKVYALTDRRRRDENGRESAAPP